MSFTPMRIWRHATMWEVTQGEVTDHPECWLNRQVIWEPLATHAPQDAEPYCCYLNTVIFYEGRSWGMHVLDGNSREARRANLSARSLRRAMRSTRYEKAAGWAVAEGMPFREFLEQSKHAFSGAETERPHT